MNVKKSLKFLWKFYFNPLSWKNIFHMAITEVCVDDTWLKKACWTIFNHPDILK